MFRFQEGEFKEVARFDLHGPTWRVFTDDTGWMLVETDPPKTPPPRRRWWQSPRGGGAGFHLEVGESVTCVMVKANKTLRYTRLAPDDAAAPIAETDVEIVATGARLRIEVREGQDGVFDD